MKDIMLDELKYTILKKKGKMFLSRNNTEYLAQKLKIVLSFQKGEWFTDSNIGLPYIPQEDMTKADHRALISACIQAKVNSIQGIKNITFFETNYDASQRKLQVRLICNTVEGEEIIYDNTISNIS